MYSWREKRRGALIAIVAAGLCVFLVISWLILSYARASCQDGVRNNGERGVDCGGSCALLCEGEALPPVVHFARAVETERGVWGAVAYLENRARGAAARSAPYIFKLYDAANLLVAERHGVAVVPAGAVFAIFEGALATGDRVPTRAVFEFTAPLKFERVSPAPAVRIGSQRFESGTVSRLDAVLENSSRKELSYLSVTALLFDEKGSVFAASETEVPRLLGLRSVPLSFSWPRVLSPPARIELLIRVFAL